MSSTRKMWLQRCEEMVGQIRELGEAARTAADLEALLSYRYGHGKPLFELNHNDRLVLSPWIALRTNGWNNYAKDYCTKK